MKNVISLKDLERMQREVLDYLTQPAAPAAKAG